MAPLSKVISTSTVGLPRLSRISRAWISAMAVMRGLVGESPSPAPRERVAGAKRRPGEGVSGGQAHSAFAPSPQPSPPVGERELVSHRGARAGFGEAVEGEEGFEEGGE